MSSIRTRMQTAFHGAARGGQAGLVAQMLTAGDHKLQLEKTENGRTPLLSACTNGHLETAKVLIRAGANIHAHDPEDFNCLHAAALGGFCNMMRLLLEKGAVLESRDDVGSTPLHAATLRDNVSAIRLLATHGASLSPQTLDGRTPLHIAANMGYVGCARELLRLGANPSTALYCGDTPLLIAVSINNVEIAEMLLSYGAYPHTVGEKGVPVLHAAAQTGSGRVVHALLEKGADPSLVGKSDMVTPLMVAAQFGRPKAARILLHAGALETYRDPFRFLTPDHVVGHLVPHVSGRVREPDLEADIHRSLARGPAFRARSWLWPTSGKATAGATVAAAITVAIAAAETGREEYKGNRLLLGKSVTGSFRFRRRRGLGKIIGGKGDGRYVIAATCRFAGKCRLN